MVDIKFDFSSFQKEAQALGAAANQIPYILANVLNTAAFAARKELIETTWPSSVQIHNPNFLRAALRVATASKYDLHVEIVDVLHRGNLGLHEFGGTKTPRVAHLAIPVSGKLVRGMRGIAKGQRPKQLIATTPKRALRILPSGIFIGEGGKLNLMYSFKTSVMQPKDVPFAQDFARVMVAKVNDALPRAVKFAMRTAR